MLARVPDIEDIKTVSENYKKILISTMALIADRYERDPDYHWIDTKLNINTGLDFSDRDKLRNKNIVYSWIQGRGLESLTLHCKWIRNNCSDITSLNLARRLEIIIDEVSESLDRAANETSEGIRELESIIRDLEFNPYDLENTEERLFCVEAWSVICPKSQQFL